MTVPPGADLLDPALLARLERVQLATRKRLAGRFGGEHRSVRTGSSLEFVDEREYVPGDDERRIDHHLWARTGLLFVRLFEAEDDVTVRLVLDTSASMGVGAKLHHAARLAGAVGFVALTRRDAVTVHAFPATGPPRRFTGRSALHPLFAHLASLQPSGRTDAVRAAMEVLRRPGPRGVSVLVSDLLTPGWDDAVSRLPARGDDVVVVHVLGREELDPELHGDLELVDVETGERLAVSVSEAVRERHRARVSSWLDDVAARVRAAGATYVRSVDDEDVGSTLWTAWQRAGVLRCSFSQPAGWWLLLLAVPVVALHVLRPRRPQVTVGSTYLWRDAAAPVSSARPWQRLRPSWLLLVQLLLVGLLAAAAAGPVRLTDAPLGDHTVFILDTSGSMAATDGRPDRLADATDRALELRRELPTGGVASIVVASPAPRVVLTTSGDAEAFEDALARVGTAGGVADFGEAFALAESLDTGRGSLSFVLLSDGGLDDDEQRLLPPGTVYERIGDGEANRAITRLVVEPKGSGLVARLTLANTGGPAVRQPVRVDVDGRTVASTEVALAEGERSDVALDLPAGDRVEAFLDGTDLLGADDRAVAVAGRRAELTVLVAGDATFVEPLLAALPGIEVVRSPTARPLAEGEDLAVYSEVPVPAEPGGPFLAVAPPGGAPGVTVSGTVEQPVPTLVRAEDPLLDGVDLSEVAIASAQEVRAPSADVLVAASDGTPLLLRSRRGPSPFVYLTFALGDSNLPLQVAYPVLGDRLVTELAGVALPSGALTVGETLPVDPQRPTTVTAPDGTTREVAPGDPAPVAERPGFYVLAADGGPTRTVAANPPGRESTLTPATTVRAEVAADRERESSPRGERSLLGWLVPPLLLLGLLEWFLARRQRAVGRRQWRLATGGRVAAAGAVLAALLAPTVTRPADRVATVFVLDASASLGRSGRAEATAWVQDALSARGGGDVAGVVLFGGDARLERVVQDSSRFEGPTVQVDPERTDLAAALRLAAAVLPTDARRRIVVVSDGRQTDGDAAAEAQRLGADGIEIDRHVVGAPAEGDVAVAEVRVPPLAREGDQVTVTALVVASRPGTAEVRLSRDGTAVEARTVELRAGDNEVAFVDVAAGSGAARYQVQVVRGGDPVPENDTAVAAVPIEGPARVLVVEGTDGVADVLVAALRAGGIEVDTAVAAALPGVDRLSSYASIVLVDADARDLSTVGLADLTTAVEDLGRGLVTIGGEHSYGLGGYRSSPLEALLPVTSEILDPLRRQRVAQVLSIDTSGSMAACHCADVSTGRTNVVSGVSKTDISRAAAARAIAALAPEDEIGVVAWSGGSSWVLDLQARPDAEAVDESLAGLVPDGPSDLQDSLTAAAGALRASDASLKHIILFSDGFTDPVNIDAVADDAARLQEEDGITVSVLATGEGAAPELERIATAGGGRFYPGTDLQRIPQIMADEAVLASRDFITEGTFVPEVTSSAEVVAGLASAPPLFGYVATTAKPAATTLLRIGPDEDPLLARWQAGLGRVASWTSDASAAWSQAWVGWDGYVSFWSAVVRDTFPAGDTRGAATATVRDGRLAISVASAEAFPDGATATARVAGPDGQRIEVPLERTGGGTFGAEVPAARSGTYAVGVTVAEGDRTLVSGTALASESYPAEYRPGPPDEALLDQLSSLTGGRGAIEPDAAFDGDGLAAGERRLDLRAPLLVLATVCFVAGVVLSRLTARPAAVLAGVRARLPRRPGGPPRVPPPRVPAPRQGADSGSAPDGPTADGPAEPVATGEAAPAEDPARAGPTGSVEELLARRRERRRPPG